MRIPNGKNLSSKKRSNTMLESYLKNRLTQKKILLMTHIVIGYPSLEESLRIIETMVDAGVDLMELQIPFSEPIADGPVILHANQMSLAGGIRLINVLMPQKRPPKHLTFPFCS
jgi:tryptophan synthase alpha chain